MLRTFLMTLVPCYFNNNIYENELQVIEQNATTILGSDLPENRTNQFFIADKNYVHIKYCTANSNKHLRISRTTNRAQRVFIF